MRRIFDYECECGEVRETFVDADGEPYVPCLLCGSPMHRIISVPRVLKPQGEEGQSLKAIHEIQRNDRVKKERIYSRC